MTHTTDWDWDRLQQYLPADMYREVQYAVSNKREEMCLAHLSQLLRAVLTYVPRHLALELIQGPVVAKNKGQFLEGTLLFADISGFTNLSENLKEIGGKAGAEEVVRVINSYLDVMLGILFKYDGLLIKFGGDAMLCLFTGKGTGGDHGAMNGLWAAWEMKQVMAERFGAVKVFQQIFPLGMKVGSNSGLLFAASVGTSEHMEYVLTGSTVERTAHAESAANKGDVLISSETYELVRDSLKAEELTERPGFYRVTDVQPSPVAQVRDQWAEIEKLLSSLERDLWGLVDRLDSTTPYLPLGVLPPLVYDPQQGQIEGQHRQVTILFANFVGMSDIIDARGFDGEIGITSDLSQYFQAMQEEVQYYGGTINKVDLYDQGDKLIVTFGAPKAHEQDARYAALTALAMQEAMGRLSSPTASAFLSQRIGINTGFVFAGNVGSSEYNRREYTVMGDDVNLAARLMSASESGQILVSKSVWDQIQGGFEVQALEPIKVKGKRDLIPIYLLQAARFISEDRIASRVIRSDMVGREAELKDLQKHFSNLLSRERKQIVAITGEAGVGKTRLIREWQQWSETIVEPGRPITRLTGRGHQSGRRANGIFVEIVEQLLMFSEDDSPEERWNKLSTRVKELFAKPEAKPETEWSDEFSNKLAYLGNLLALDLSQKESLTERVEQLDVEALQVQTHLAVCDLLTHAAQGGALVLILEDLHWADSASLDLLKFALDRVSDRSPVFFCLVYRPRIELPIWQVWQEIEKWHPDCLSISLAELGNADSRQLLFNLLQTDQAPADFQELILRETDGNPLYVEEVLRSLMDEGTIVRDDDAGWRVARSVERIRVPDTLQQIIQSRIDELDFRSPGARRALWMASVIGEEFNEDVWLQLFTSTGRQEKEFLLHLRELKRMDMIHEIERVEEGRTRWLYQFRHGLVQQVAYENMLVERRREYHREIGRFLEIKYSDRLREQYDALARHYERGQVWAKALDYHLKAGQKAQQAYANAEARMHFERALAMAGQVSPDPSGDRIAVMEGLGAVLKVTGDFDTALGHLETVLTLLEESSVEKKRQAVTCHQIGRIHEMKGNYETAMDWVERGRTVLSGVEGAELEAARLHLLAGIVAVRRGDLTAAFAEAEQALSLAETAQASPEAAQTRNLLGVLYRARGELEKATFHCERSLVLYEQLANPLKIAVALTNLGAIAFEQGDWPNAVNYCQQALEKHEMVGDAYRQALTSCNLANLHCHQGQLERALVHAQRGLEISKTLQVVFGLVHAHDNMGSVYQRQGKLAQARAHLEEGLRLSEAHNVQEFNTEMRNLLAEVYLRMGEVATAEAQARQALAIAMEQRRAVDEAVARRVLSQIFQAQGDVTKAEEALQASRTLLESAGKRYELGRTLLALAELYADDDERRPEGQVALTQAHAIFEDLGAALDLAEAKALSQRMTMNNGTMDDE